MESSGIASFTFFMPLGCGANMTAFHYETKRFRSLNCGCGDLIFQPLATEENLKKFERVHAALFGRFSRSCQVSVSLDIRLSGFFGFQLIPIKELTPILWCAALATCNVLGGGN